MGFIYKILLCGEGAVGKSALVYRLKTGEFNEALRMTIGVDFYPHRFTYGDPPEEFTLQIWDLGGQERFQGLHSAYIKGAHGAILMHDLTRNSTAFALSKWHKLATEENKNLPIILVGSKLDLVDQKTAIKFLLDPFFDQFRAIKHVVISSKTGVNIQEVFTSLVEHLRKTKPTGVQRATVKSVSTEAKKSSEPKKSADAKKSSESKKSTLK